MDATNKSDEWDYVAKLMLSVSLTMLCAFGFIVFEFTWSETYRHPIVMVSIGTALIVILSAYGLRIAEKILYLHVFRRITLRPRSKRRILQFRPVRFLLARRHGNGTDKNSQKPDAQSNDVHANGNGGFPERCDGDLIDIRHARTDCHASTDDMADSAPKKLLNSVPHSPDAPHMLNDKSTET